MNILETRQLLCTFSSIKEFKNLIDDIHKFYDIFQKRIFVFQNEKKPIELFLTYNVIGEQKRGSKFPNTILIHRKKQTNTLYTLNAMNRLIEEENGKPDKSFQINWEYYKNSLIITGDVSIRIIPLKIYTVLD